MPQTRYGGARNEPPEKTENSERDRFALQFHQCTKVNPVMDASNRRSMATAGTKTGWPFPSCLEEVGEPDDFVLRPSQPNNLKENKQPEVD